MPATRVSKSVSPPRRSKRSLADGICCNWIVLLAALGLFMPQAARAQEALALLNADTSAAAPSPAGEDDAAAPKPKNVSWFKRPVESELIVEGMASYGNYRIFASGTDCKLYTAGLEYDRHSWDYFRLLHARLDYVAEVLPLVLLNEPDKADIWGNPKSYAHKIVPGFGFSPIGFRMMWREHKAIEPYLTAKGGLIAFPIKVLSTDATYVSFSLQSGFGVQTRLTPRLGLRLGLWNDFHFSDAFMVPVNPGLDVMNANLGLSYHFGR